MGRCSDARDRLLATATKLLHERGYTAVSVSDICSAAGLKKGSFYHFFRSKHALVLATLDRFGEHQELTMANAADESRPAREQLIGMFTSMYQGFCAAQRTYGAAHGCPIGNIAQEMAHRDAEMREKLASIFARWQQRLETVLHRAASRQELDIKDPSRAAEALLAYVQGATLLAKTNHDPEVFLRLSHGMVALAEADLPTAHVPAFAASMAEHNPCQVEEPMS